MEEPAEIWLCLSRGNALGAYHAGAYSVLHRAGIRPVRIAGTSVSAIVAAIIAGNNWDNRVARLDEFWEIATDDLTIANVAPHWNGSKIASSLGTLMQGRPPLFRPSAAVWWQRLFSFSSPSLFGRSGLRDELRRLVDFDHLNNGGVRLIINAVDVTTGQEQVYDSAKMTITVDHLIASSAFPVIFPPEEIDGHHMVDEGLAANLPVLPYSRSLPLGVLDAWLLIWTQPEAAILKVLIARSIGCKTCSFPHKVLARLICLAGDPRNGRLEPPYCMSPTTVTAKSVERCWTFLRHP
ncbi:patatin-like phospholipase family protein [Rhizobium hidalgonense]|nr:patatin-like phospholipase family protein [Rhizobium hidalgonense]MDR9776930.1 patatin-like phospholipase family protein [Rhizobium hidalgonense]MDR9814017.1 patatin-like phospholipase family protein [Rhizobium hidalgonense]MDR9820663.1 patatin-like phospholipase family protein [Rhizobium hidalgonense]PON08019.1 hypothetical protein ATY29_08040 [Rhizobium hidalgonense]